MATSFANLSASESGPAVSEDDQGFRTLEEVEDGGKGFGPAFPAQSACRRICPTNRLVLLLMGFCATLTISILLIGAQRIRLKRDSEDIREALRGLNQTTSVQLGHLQQKRNSTGRKLTVLETALGKKGEEMEEVKQHIEGHLTTLQLDLKTLHCDLVELKSNGSKSGCCPKGWTVFENSCYWMSSERASWDLAKLSCEKQNAHLVIINSADENAFVTRLKRLDWKWIGLTDVTETWQWVDGSRYTFRQDDWEPSQPDHWYGHGLGGGEDCVHLQASGLWNDNHCSRRIYWVCEIEL